MYVRYHDGPLRCGFGGDAKRCSGALMVQYAYYLESPYNGGFYAKYRSNWSSPLTVPEVRANLHCSAPFLPTGVRSLAISVNHGALDSVDGL